MRRRWTVVVVVIAGLAVSACARTPEEAVPHAEPVKIEPVSGTKLNSLTLTARAVRRLAIETTPIGRDGARGEARKVIPYAAIVYDVRGNTFAYTNPAPLVFVRRRVEVDRINGERAVLSGGPAYGTPVVRVGAAELLGAEFGVGH